MFCLWIFAFGLLRGGGIGIVNGETSDCPELSVIDGDQLPQDQFIAVLTDPCRYDKFVRPNATTPFDIYVKVDVNHLEAAQSQFTAYLTFQYEYRDTALEYATISPKRSIIFGDESLREKIWAPNIFMKDEDETTVVSIEEKDVIVSIAPSGSVTYTYKMVAKFYCWMNLKKFPFDTQRCSLAFSDWSYNNQNLVLSWNAKSAFNIADNLHFTEFVLDESEYTQGTNGGPYETKELSSSVGTFSELVIKFRFHRDIGFYMLDFFVPSYLLVFTAWVTFWLQADAGPPRATLGASTVVAFITLHLGVTKDIPKVSYIKASDIWFLGISCFIFFSLAEFAFVNVIWRRKKVVELKKDKPKYILKGAVMPRVARSDLKKHASTNTLNGSEQTLNGKYSSQTTLSNGDSMITIPNDETQQQFMGTTMTPQEVAIWIDRKARIVFPIVFLIFNILYWVFVYCL